MPETERLLDIARMFDVNLVAGMSFAVYTLKNSDTKTVAADLDKILGGPNNPYAGLLRVVPIERMNAFLLISPQASAIEKLPPGCRVSTKAEWIPEAGRNSMCTHCSTRRLTSCSRCCRRHFPAVQWQPTAPMVAPGQTSTTLGAPVSPIPGQSIVQPGNTVGTTAPRQTGCVQPEHTGRHWTSAARNATIVADKDRNALLIVATAAEYAAVEAVIRRLDVPPKQSPLNCRSHKLPEGRFSVWASVIFAVRQIQQRGEQSDCK